jgi:hypothetical protein
MNPTAGVLSAGDASFGREMASHAMFAQVITASPLSSSSPPCCRLDSAASSARPASSAAVVNAARLVTFLKRPNGLLGTALTASNIASRAVVVRTYVRNAFSGTNAPSDVNWLPNSRALQVPSASRVAPAPSAVAWSRSS